MVKFFYHATFEYSNHDETEGFDLGIFSTKSQAEEKINKVKDKKGFKDFDLTSFKIQKFGVHFDRKDVDKEKAVLYSVWVEYPDGPKSYSWVIFDYFPSYQKAKSKMRVFINQTRIGKKHPNEFNISKIKINDFSSWSEGFEKYTENNF